MTFWTRQAIDTTISRRRKLGRRMTKAVRIVRPNQTSKCGKNNKAKNDDINQTSIIKGFCDQAIPASVHVRACPCRPWKITWFGRSRASNRWRCPKRRSKRPFRVSKSTRDVWPRWSVCPSFSVRSIWVYRENFRLNSYILFLFFCKSIKNFDYFICLCVRLLLL